MYGGKDTERWLCHNRFFCVSLFSISVCFESLRKTDGMYQIPSFEPQNICSNAWLVGIAHLASCLGRCEGSHIVGSEFFFPVGSTRPENTEETKYLKEHRQVVCMRSWAPCASHIISCAHSGRRDVTSIAAVDRAATCSWPDNFSKCVAQIKLKCENQQLGSSAVPMCLRRAAKNSLRCCCCSLWKVDA